jgi:hypothetical protein
MHEVYPKPGDQSWKPGRGQILWQTSEIALMTLMENRHLAKWDGTRIGL